MRKLIVSLAIMFCMAGLVMATDVIVTKYDGDKKEVTVKDGDKETTYKFSDKLKVTVTDKDGNATDGKFEDLEARLKKGAKSGKMKIDITTDKETITEVKIKKGGKN